MGKMVEEKKRKKKGRPSLLDLQKRRLKEQQEELRQQRDRDVYAACDNYRTATAASLRRSARRNPSPETEHDGEDSEGMRGERKTKLIHILAHQNSPAGLAASLNSEEGGESGPNRRKRKIDSIGDRSGGTEMGAKSVSAADNGQGGTRLEEVGPPTPLPNKKLLLFILDRLQKKDTYGVFAEPVDPEELPDYHEIIEHPMDFGTIRKKLDAGDYANLEQFEKDVFLICSNAMQYNASDTIYYRQARSIKELAIKNFGNLRQDSDDNEPETKIARRGRPPNKNLKGGLGKPALEHSVPVFADAVGYKTEHNKGSAKNGIFNSSGKLHGSHHVCANWLSEFNFDRSKEVSLVNSWAMKHGKKQFEPDEDRRKTYKQYLASANGGEPSVLPTFGGERKQLLAVGLYTDHAYSKSLARFAARLGPLVWKIAARKIEKCLPFGMKFGPGWVGENDIPLQRPPLSSQHPAPPSSLAKLHSAKASSPGSPSGRISQQPEDDSTAEKRVPPIQYSSDAQLTKHIRPGTNGLNGTYGPDLFDKTGKEIGPTPATETPFQPSPDAGTSSVTNNDSYRPCDSNNEQARLCEDPRVTKATAKLPGCGSGASNAQSPGRHPRPTDEGGLRSQKQPRSGSAEKSNIESVPRDLSVRFRMLGSPRSCRVDPTQPDLVLQL